ncbi:recombinase family protein [Runella zeae]|uniref:recombinase family protein n=1 Tax=Runella zeae TaxID=94255 RepID=UPI00042A2316|nr:recombinase family protein [Runella zeae]
MNEALPSPVNAVIFTRVSKRSQEYQRQIADLKAVAEKRGWTVAKIITEKITGIKGNADRESIEQLLQLCDTKQIQKVLITEVSRLGRRPSQTHQILEHLTEKKISIYIHQYSAETLLLNGKLNPAVSMIFSVTADMARQERETMIDRIVSGMDEARRQGKTFGRKKGRLYSDDDLRAKYSKPLKDLQQGISIRKVAKIYDISPDTVQRLKKLM